LKEALPLICGKHLFGGDVFELVEILQNLGKVKVQQKCRDQDVTILLITIPGQGIIFSLGHTWRCIGSTLAICTFKGFFPHYSLAWRSFKGSHLELEPLNLYDMHFVS